MERVFRLYLSALYVAVPGILSVSLNIYHEDSIVFFFVCFFFIPGEHIELNEVQYSGTLSHCV
jgi:hypothetical protein